MNVYGEGMYTEIQRENVYRMYTDTERECTPTHTYARTHKRTHTYLDHLSPRGVMTVGEGNGEELNPKP